MLPRAGVIHRALAMACFVGGLKIGSNALLSTDFLAFSTFMD